MFGAVRKTQGIVDLYRRELSAPQGQEELVLSTPEGKFPTDWSRDGKYILYDCSSAKRGSNVWALPMQGDRKPIELVATEFNDAQGQFAPDGRWIAYQSDRTGRWEIYVRPFPGGGGEQMVSVDGGSQVRWNANGQELFYIGADDRLMAVPIRISPAGTIEPGVPTPLFATNVGSTVPLVYRQQYVVSADGRSFILNAPVGEGTASPISVILNWKPPR